jgi:lysozyme family protein
MEHNREAAINAVIDEEIYPQGRGTDEPSKWTWSDDPDDPGGCTNWGITMRTLADWRGQEVVTKDEVKALRRPEAIAIYAKRYWNRVSELPSGLDYAAFDCAVNMGVARCHSFLRMIASELDYARPELIKESETPWAILRLAKFRENYYRTRPHFFKYGRGWLARVERQTKEGLKLAMTV